MRKYEAKANNAGLDMLLGSVRISANGNKLNVSCELTDDQLIGLTESNTFAGLT
jgi:hypothetical protein